MTPADVQALLGQLLAIVQKDQSDSECVTEIENWLDVLLHGAGGLQVEEKKDDLARMDTKADSTDSRTASSNEVYRVEVERAGCERCAAGQMHTVVGPGEVAISTSFELEEDAEDIARYMNTAFAAGRKSQAVRPT